MEESMEGTQDLINTQAFPPGPIAGNGHTPSPVAETIEAALPQELALQNLLDQNLVTITGQLGPVSPAQFMTLSGNACKLYTYCSSADWVGIPLQEDRLPFGVGLKDIRTVLRVLNELWQHRCIQVHFDQTAVDTPLELRVKGKQVVLESENGVLPIPRIYVRCVEFPEHLPDEVEASLNAKLRRQIAYHQQRAKDLQGEKAWWEQRMRRQYAPRDASHSDASWPAGQG
jgi:hypothetical protein